MSNHHFHLTVTVLLSLGLGYSLSSSTATGYPAASAISMGSNPVRSFAGTIDLASGSTVSGIISAPATQDLIVTDIVTGLMQTNYYCYSNGRLRLVDDSGTTHAVIPVYTGSLNATPTAPTYLQGQSGIRIPANTTVHAEWTFSFQNCPTSNYDLDYTFGGYLTQP